MSSREQINNLITSNNWREVVNLLNNEHGFIGRSGGRYSQCDGNKNDRFDINKICWKVYDAIQSERFKQQSNDERAPFLNVIKELRRLYDETDTALANASQVAFVATRAYDLFEKIYDGLQPVERLEECIDLDDFDADQKV